MLGLPVEIREFSQTTRSAAEAATVLECDVSRIAKSLVFRLAKSKSPVWIITSGSNRVNEATVREILSEPIEKASAEFVREHTGFSIGGVPPLAHERPVGVLIDEDLLRYDEIWAAAGTPHAVFRLDQADLPRMTGGRLVCIT